MVKHVYENVVNAAGLVKSFDAFGLCLASVVLAFLLGRPWRESLRRDRWRLALVPVVLSVGVYLPVFAGTPRSYYFIFPLRSEERLVGKEFVIPCKSRWWP